jgi:hypothetical protein
MALQYALLKAFRLKNSRLGYYSGRTFISIGGTPAGPGQSRQVLIDSLSIAYRLNEIADTLTASVIGTAAPVEGQAIRITLGSVNNGRALFAGNLLKVTQTYLADNPHNVSWNIEAADPTWGLNAILVTARYRNLSASSIAWDLVTRFAPAGYSTAGIVDNLPFLDEITFTNTYLMDALAQLATRIGGYTYCDYDKTIQFFTTDLSQNPATLTVGLKSFREVTFARDLTQIATRVYSEGGGVNALAPALPGDSRIAVEDAAWYSPVGGWVTSGPQRIWYGGLDKGGGGSLVGPGVTPSSAPTMKLGLGLGVDVGTHGYAYTWVTASGETRPSPVASIATIPTIAPPTLGPYLTFDDYAVDPLAAGGWKVGDLVEWAYSWALEGRTDRTTVLSPIASARAVLSPYWFYKPGDSAKGFYVYANPTSALPSTAYIYVWHRVNGGPWRIWAFSAGTDVNAPGFPNVTNGTGSYRFMDPAAYSRTAAAPSVNPTYQQPIISGIAVGPTGTTQRKVYRTKANATQLLFLGTIADNTTTVPGPDGTPDSALGANAPIADTSGLPQATGQVNAGSTSMIVASTAPFSPTGGIVLVGTQPIWYGGLSATALTGIPATGPGSLTASVPYNTVVIIPPQLTGVPGVGAVGAIVWAINKGDPINVLAIVDDPSSQAALAAKIGGTGVREVSIQDGRLSEQEARSRGWALIVQRAYPFETFSHRSRDPLTRPGAMVTIGIGPPTNLFGSWRIQDVTVANFFGNQPERTKGHPTYTAQSSSARFTFEDLVRQIKQSAETTT